MKTFGSKLQNIFGNNTENRLNSIRDFDDNSEECVAMEYDNDDDDFNDDDDDDDDDD